ncbi:CsgG/HfaB family protein [Endozoicomonadaceae bacterium StTr2]
MQWIKVLLAAALFLSSLATAGEVKVEARGTGMSEESAIEQALVQAVRQVNGLDIDSIQHTNESRIDVNEDSIRTEEIKRNVLLKAKGQIAGYDIISNDCNDSGCVAELVVSVYQYKAPGLPTDKRRRIAVLPFTGGKEFRKMVTQEVQDQLVQSRRFAVLDRKEEQAYKTEKSLWLSDDVAISEKARLGKVLGLDYILVGSIVRAGVNRWTTKVELTGEKKNHVRTAATVRYQIIAVATRQVKWSDTVSVTLNNVGSLNRAAAAISKKIAGEALGNIYPLRVVSLNGGQIILNQGGKTMRKGSYYNVYSLGELIVDPYTNEPLGQTETRVATIRVTRVEAKLTYAKVVDGNSGDIKKGFIVRPGKAVARPAKKKTGTPTSKESDVEVPAAGGVIL